MIELSVVAPTFNEKDNVLQLTQRLEEALKDVAWEVVFVDDDSPDGTADVVRALAQSKSNVRCLQRIGRRGLSRAVVEGILATSAPFIAVIDADLQHDETLLPRMLARMRAGDVDIVVGSRYTAGGSVGEWDSSRAAMSRFATSISRLIVSADLTDPMSGFFMIRRDAFLCAVRRLSGEGYKILLDLFASAPTPMRFAELSYTFRSRLAGESKLDSAVMWEYLMLIVDKRLGHILPARFVLFSVVGASGVGVHLGTLWALHRFAHVEFGLAQTVATLTAMTTNYFFNNFLTYRDRRRRGWKFLTGLLSFYVVCSIGVVANVGVANVIFEHEYKWWLAGIAGAIIGTVWNYAASAIVTWRRK
jgi:dolichol-phosphate mannosyltransferase